MVHENFKMTEIEDYRDLLGTEKIKRIIDGMPEGLSKIEQAYYVYIELGKILKEDPNYALRSDDEKKDHYDDKIDDELYGICKSMSELYVTILKQIGIDADLIRNVPERTDASHVDTVLKIDGSVYLANLISDLANIKAGRRTHSFGINADELLEKRTENLIKMIEQLGIDDERIREAISESQKTGSLDGIHELVDSVEWQGDIKRLHRMIDGFGIVSRYIENIKESYPNLKSVDRGKIEKMDAKFGYISQIPGVEEEGKGHHLLYTNDVLHELRDEMRDPEKVKKYIYGGKEVPEEEQLRYKINYLCNVIKYCVPHNENTGYLDEIINIHRIFGYVLSPEEIQRVVPYAVQTSPDHRDITSVVKLKPLNKSGKNTYYIYSKENKTYEPIEESELKKHFEKIGLSNIKIVGKGRFFNERLNELRGEEIIDELRE